MTQRHLAGARILARGASHPAFAARRREAARAFGAHEGQDVAGVMASLALRTGGDLDAVLAAFDRGEIVRGYPMRGTVFSVAATPRVADRAVRRASLRAGDLAAGGALRLEDPTWLARRRCWKRSRRSTRCPGPRPGRAAQGAALRLRGGRYRHWSGSRVPRAERADLRRCAAYGRWRDGGLPWCSAQEWLRAGTDLQGAFGGDEVAATAELALRYFTTHGPAWGAGPRLVVELRPLHDPCRHHAQVQDRLRLRSYRRSHRRPSPPHARWRRPVGVTGSRGCGAVRARPEEYAARACEGGDHRAAPAGILDSWCSDTATGCS